MFPANLNGTDFVPSLLVYVQEPLTVALIGGKGDVVDKAAENFHQKTPWHKFVVISDGFFGPQGTQSVLDDLSALKPDILLVGMGSPVQEKWVDQNIQPEHGKLVFTVGALFDFVSSSLSSFVFDTLGFSFWMDFLLLPVGMTCLTSSPTGLNLVYESSRWSSWSCSISLIWSFIALTAFTSCLLPVLVSNVSSCNWVYPLEWDNRNATSNWNKLMKAKMRERIRHQFRRHDLIVYAIFSFYSCDERSGWAYHHLTLSIWHLAIPKNYCSRVLCVLYHKFSRYTPGSTDQCDFLVVGAHFDTQIKRRSKKGKSTKDKNKKKLTLFYFPVVYLFLKVLSLERETVLLAVILNWVTHRPKPRAPSARCERLGRLPFVITSDLS